MSSEPGMSSYAIVGLSCLFPGAGTPEEFWENLVGGVDSRHQGTPDTFGVDPQDAADADPDHRITCTRGGFVTDPAFDPSGYRIPAEQLQGLDRVYRWSLTTARAALEDAGRSGGPDRSARTGVVLGNYTFPTVTSSELVLPLLREAVSEGMREAGVPLAEPVQTPAPTRADLAVGGLPALLVGRALGLGGPRLALDAACSSALYAVKLACDHLETGAADVMLAGGVCAPDPALIHLSFSDLQAYPRNGVSQPFDASSTGIITGQGAGFVVLKRLADAVRDGDTIHAVIEGLALSNDGSGRHVLCPNASGQLATYRLAYGQAGIDPEDVDYVECHATGTPLGDATELAALAQWYAGRGRRPRLGSVKGNVGHLLTVAGMTSLLKTVLAMRHGVVPPSLGIVEPLRSADATMGGDLVIREPIPWPSRAEGAVPRAGVSAFGFGGTNAHAILRRHDPAAREATPAPAAVPATPAGATHPGVASLAVTGIGAHVGDAGTAAELDRALREGLSISRPLPARRWYGLGDADTAPEGSYLEEFEVAAARYQIPPKELGHFNAQHLLMLRVAEEALADDGLHVPEVGLRRPERPPRRVAVVIATDMEPRTHAHRARLDIGRHVADELARAGLTADPDALATLQQAARAAVHEPVAPNEVLSYIGNIMASRISARWNLTGPAFTVSAGSAGAATALDVAALLLRDETVEAVLVGAVDLAGGVESVLAGSGEPHRPGDGAAAVVLRRRADVERARGDGTGEPDAGDPDAGTRHWYGCLDAVTIRHAAEGEQAPVAEATAAALAAAATTPDAVGLLALHSSQGGLDTRAHEAAVAAALDGGSGVSLARVTDTVGDPGAAGGLLAVLTALLAARGAYLPRQAADGDPDAPSSLVAPRSTRPWLRRDTATERTAVVSLTGSLGTASAVVVTAAPADPAMLADPARGVRWAQEGAPHVLPVPAADRAALGQALAALRERLAAGEDPAVLASRACADLPAAGPEARLRAVLVGADTGALLKDLDRLVTDLPRLAPDAEWATPGGSFLALAPLGPDGKVALVYPGAFNAYLGLGRDLFRLFPGLLTRFETRCPTPAHAFRDAALWPAALADRDRRGLMAAEEALLADMPAMLSTSTSFAMVATDLMRSVLRVPVTGALGYSLGESSMLRALGVWAPDPATDARIDSTPLFSDRLCHRRLTVREAWGLGPDVPDSAVWASQVLVVDAGRARATLAAGAERYSRLYLTHVNSPGEVVVAGAPEQLRALVAELGCSGARTPGEHVMHCSMVDPELAELALLNTYPVTGDGGELDLFTAGGYQRLPSLDTASLAGNIAETLRSCVDFPRLVAAAHDAGYRYFVEVGPGATCTRWVDESLAGRPHAAMCLDRRGRPGAASVAHVVARLVSHGVPVDLAALQPAAAPPAGDPLAVRVPCGGPAVGERMRNAVLAAGLGAGAWDATPARDVPAAAPVPAPPVPAPPVPAPSVPAPAASPDSSPVPVPSLPAPAPIASSAMTSSPPPTSGVPQGTPAPAPLPALAGPAPLPALAGPAPTGTARTTAGSVATGSVATGSVATAPAPSVVSFSGAPSPVAAVHAENQDVSSRLGALLAERRGGDVPAGAAEPPPAPPRERGPKPPGVVFDAEDILTFATGRIADVFGPDFADIDTLATRVRLPEPPYLFADRVTSLEAEPGVLGPARLTSQYDVAEDAWFCVDGMVPAAVTIEAGQCDMLLVSYLGIDRFNKGERFYRLLDSTLVFHGDLPTAGQTLTYDIAISRFVSNGDTRLFFFNYRCFADGELILELKDACAGFFTQEELEASSGIVTTALEAKRKAALPKGSFKPLARTDKTRLEPADMAALGAGRIAEVFGPAYDQGGLNPSLRLPDERLRMVDEILSIDRLGGPRGLGHLSAVKYLDPDGWYFRCHFTDDPVLAGSLVAEGGVQILQAYALSLGMQLVLPDARFQTVPGLETQVKVRGQVTPKTPSIRYEVEITELTLLPRPTVVADITVYDGERATISMKNFGVQLREKPGTPYRVAEGGRGVDLGRRNAAGEVAIINELHLAHAAKGDLGTAMGPEFDVYHDHRAPHIPNGDFQFVDRIMVFEGERRKMLPGSIMETEYDSPPEAWYYSDNAAPFLPNCVLMETSLQAAILLGYYQGATLDDPQLEFGIRNLDGHAEVLRAVDLRGKTIRQRTQLLMSSRIQGTVLQKFAYELAADGIPFYRGESMFGYFTAEGLSAQVGLDAGRNVRPWIEQLDAPPAGTRRIDLATDPSYYLDETGGRLHLPDGQLRLLDWADIVPGAGTAGKGYVRGSRRVRPEDWYYSCHFHRDPVMPGSLGVEAMVQGLQLFALEQGLAAGIARPRFALARGTRMEWTYRGQIVREDPELQFDLHVTDVRREGDRVVLVADGSLYKPSMRIYGVKNLAVEIVPDDLNEVTR